MTRDSNGGMALFLAADDLVEPAAGAGRSPRSHVRADRAKRAEQLRSSVIPLPDGPFLSQRCFRSYEAR
jgi:hypothetical protein